MDSGGEGCRSGFTVGLGWVALGEGYGFGKKRMSDGGRAVSRRLLSGILSSTQGMERDREKSDVDGKATVRERR